MPKLAYYASPVPDKETWFETPEGYRLYRNVNIARTGSQSYLGRELKSNRGYDRRWNLKDEHQYQVFRPLEEVTDPATLASFEGKSVLDEHPPNKALIDALDEYDGVSQGHMQNVRVGRQLSDGETPLVADLWVKNPELNLKVEGGTREVSCGYRFILSKDETGRLIMTKIRGNHVAVVPRGRAGPEIAIGDAVSPDVSATPTQTKRRTEMSLTNRLIRAIGFQDWAKDAKPEEVADALEKIEKGTADAWRYPQYATNGEHETFETPPEQSVVSQGSTSDPQDWWRDSAAAYPKPTMTTTTVEQIEQKARLQEKPEPANRLSEFHLEDMDSSVRDAEPRIMDFFNGRSHEEGRKAFNQARIARGLAPIPEGRR